VKLVEWLTQRVPAFTRQDWDRAYELGRQDGYLRGYRAGVQDAHRLDRIRATGSGAPGGPMNLRLVNGGDE